MTEVEVSSDVTAQETTSSDGVPAAEADAATGESSQSAAGSSLLTRTESDETALEDGKEDGHNKEAQKETDPAMIVPDKPENYALNFAEDVKVDEGLLSGFKNAAHELGLRQGQAQALADFYAKNEAARGEAQFKALAEMKTDWEKQITSRPSFRQDAAEARKTLVTFGSFGAVNENGEPALHPDIKAIFDESLVGSHPKVFQMFVDIGRALAEPEARGRGVGGVMEKSLMDRLWPDMK